MEGGWKRERKEAEASQQKNTAADIIQKKFKRLHISDETKKLVKGLSLSADEMDEKTKKVGLLCKKT